MTAKLQNKQATMGAYLLGVLELPPEAIIHSFGNLLGVLELPPGPSHIPKPVLEPSQTPGKNLPNLQESNQVHLY